MSLLREVLDKVLGGETAVKSLGELELLRRIATIEELQRLEKVEQEFRARDHKDRSRSTTPLTRLDAERIVEYPSDCSVEELERTLRHTDELKLSTREVETIRQALSRMAGDRLRNEGHPSELKRLGYRETPKGPIDPHTVSSFERLRLAGLRAIDACVKHTGRGCACWLTIRETLWRARGSFPDSTPESWMCDRLLDELSSYDGFKLGGYKERLENDD